MFLYRCASCGSDRVQLRSVNEGFSYGKAAAGVFLFGTVGAVAGMAGKETTKYFCPRCGQTLDYPMSATTAMNIDMALMKRYDPSNETTLMMYKRMYPGIDWDSPSDAAQKVKERASINPNATTESLLQRIEDFVEDSDWDNANHYCEFLLDKEPSNPEVYKKKILIENQVTDIYELGFKLDAERRLLEGPSYNKLIKYGGEDGKKWIKEVEDIKNEFFRRRINARREEKYNKLVEKVNLNSSIEELKTTADEFKKLVPFQESERYYYECIGLIARREEEKAAQEKEKEYQTWIGIIDAPKSKVDDLNRAIAGLEAMGDYKECSAYIQKALNAVPEAEMAEKRHDRLLKWSLVLISLFVVFCFLAKMIILPALKYHQASKMLNDQEFEAAYNEFRELGDFRDGKQKANEARYQQGKELVKLRKFDEAIGCLEELYGYEDRDVLIEYAKAMRLFDTGHYYDAKKLFLSIDGYLDSTSMAYESCYLHAKSLFNQTNYEEAFNELRSLPEISNEYPDASELLTQCSCWMAKRYYGIGDYENAIKTLEIVKGDSSADTIRKQYMYEYAKICHLKKYYAKAVELYEALEDYQRSAELLAESKYQYVVAHKYYQFDIVPLDGQDNYKVYSSRSDDDMIIDLDYLIDLQKMGYKDIDDIIKYQMVIVKKEHISSKELYIKDVTIRIPE